jgi:hypothetical protein
MPQRYFLFAGPVWSVFGPFSIVPALLRARTSASARGNTHGKSSSRHQMVQKPFRKRRTEAGLDCAGHRSPQTEWNRSCPGDTITFPQLQIIMGDLFQGPRCTIVPTGCGLRNRSDHAGLTVAHRLETPMSEPMKTLHQLSLSYSRGVSLAFALLCFVGSSGSAHAASTGPQSWPPSQQVTSQFAIADFDGDRRPDLATVQSSSLDTHYWITIQLSTGPRRTLSIIALKGGLQVIPRDVNGDDFPDIIVTTQWTNRPVAVLLNDGRGNFRAFSPSAFPGAFTTSEESYASATAETMNATPALLSRCPKGNCLKGSRFSSPRYLTVPRVLWTSHNLPFSSVVSFFGRAPPSFVLHI